MSPTPSRFLSIHQSVSLPEGTVVSQTEDTNQVQTTTARDFAGLLVELIGSIEENAARKSSLLSRSIPDPTRRAENASTLYVIEKNPPENSPIVIIVHVYIISNFLFFSTRRIILSRIKFKLVGVSLARRIISRSIINTSFYRVSKIQDSHNIMWFFVSFFLMCLLFFTSFFVKTYLSSSNLARRIRSFFPRVFRLSFLSSRRIICHESSSNQYFACLSNYHDPSSIWTFVA